MPYAQTNLPPPLSTTENYQLLKLLQADPGDDEVRGKLIEGNIRLVIHIANKFFNIGTVDELTSIGTIGLIKAANSFNLDKKVKFATYASTCITNEILMYARKTKKDRVVTSLDTVLSSDMDGGELTLMDVLSDDRVGEFSESFTEQDNIDDMKEALDQLPEKDREVLKLYYLNNLRQRGTGEALGISQSYVSRLQKRALKKVRAIIDKKYKGDIVTVQALGRATRIREEKKMSNDKFMNIRVNGKAEMKVIELLDSTRDNYKDISAKTGVKYTRVAELGREVRSPELRRELKAEQVKLNSQKRTNKKVNKPTNVEEGINFNSSKKNSKPSDYLLKNLAENDHIMQAAAAKLRKEYMGDIDEESAAKAMEILGDKIKAQEVVIEQAPLVFPDGPSTLTATIASSEEPTKGIIKRSTYVNAESSGEDVSVEAFVQELRNIEAMLVNSSNPDITFEIKVTAKQK
ncbi:RNA polymerase sigma factor [Bacillus phage vB_BmeM-Goe8]|uniref:RNA polymerase sigma factor n=1 Tax=Bacillus phage vB_BmeM-Goe8 TaxID=2593638 RepID=A0A516KN22_9CAUD|nr:RNA polymerase sigma factor [Bacillus phage vB_BmeM-Goe8]QDP42999.1 RNA polymerase sigma factor [Bacillus phage vB_BmeM-Goe8]